MPLTMGQDTQISLSASTAVGECASLQQKSPCLQRWENALRWQKRLTGMSFYCRQEIWKRYSIQHTLQAHADSKQAGR